MSDVVRRVMVAHMEEWDRWQFWPPAQAVRTSEYRRWEVVPLLSLNAPEEFHELRKRHAARAAIAALRDPTDAMCVEGAHASNVTIDASWRAMIDVALAAPKRD